MVVARVAGELSQQLLVAAVEFAGQTDDDDLDVVGTQLVDDPVRSAQPALSSVGGALLSGGTGTVRQRLEPAVGEPQQRLARGAGSSQCLLGAGQRPFVVGPVG